MSLARRTAYRLVLEGDDDDHRPEDLLGRRPRRRVDRGEHGGSEPVPRAVGAGAAHGDRCVVGHERGDAGQVGLGDQRAHLGRLECRVTHSHAAHGRLEQGQEALVHRALDEDAQPRAAVLAGVVEDTRRRTGRRQLEVGVGKDDVGTLAPSSRVTRLTCSAQPAMTRRPTSVEPVKHTLRTATATKIAAPTTLPFPGRICSTPSGSPDSSASSPMRSTLRGVSSAGLTTTVLPAARAGTKPQPAMAMGKFHGTIMPTTPRGSWKVTSTPPGTGIWRPLWRSGAPE